MKDMICKAIAKNKSRGWCWQCECRSRGWLLGTVHRDRRKYFKSLIVKGLKGRREFQEEIHNNYMRGGMSYGTE